MNNRVGGARVAFLGSPEFAVAMLRAVLDSGADVVGVVTQPDRPAGRGKKMRAPPVKEFALEMALDVWQPTAIRGGRLRRWLQVREVDLAIVAAFGRILTPPMLRAPRLGCVNLHASLLPRWRGASPIHRAIVAGDKVSGVCLMQMEKGLDTGPVLARVEVPIADEDTAAALHDKLAEAGAALLSENMAALLAGELTAVAQAEEGMTYAPLLRKEEGEVDWRQSATAVCNRIRGMAPWPGAWSIGPDGQRWKIHADRLRRTYLAGQPGEILAIGDEDMVIGCGEGAVAIGVLQRPGKRRGDAASVLRGARIEPGARFGDTR